MDGWMVEWVGVRLSYMHGYSDGLCGGRERRAGGKVGRCARAPAVLEEMMGLDVSSKGGAPMIVVAVYR